MTTAASHNIHGRAATDRRARMRLAAAAVLGAALAPFAVLDSQTVRVHWIVTTTRT
jgi:hypothetical protein